MNAMNKTVRPQLRASMRRAFTLIELLIVIALTAVLFTLLLIPLIGAIRYTQQAQIITAAQDAARTTRERLTRELGTALFVFDGTSHPFIVTGASTYPDGTPRPGPADDRYTNFLDLEIPGIVPANGTNPGSYTSIVAHAYACKLDFAQPKAVSGSATQIDPTTNEPITYRQSQNGSAIVSDPALVFPLAAGTTVTRYWIGLKDPSKPYMNTREGKSPGNTDNTYILYRAQFQPYVSATDLTTGAVLVPSSVVSNTSLFATRPKLDANGNPVLDAKGNPVTMPELDDPDFFRYVKAGDVNWLDDTHAAYTASTAQTHNTLVGNWVQIAKPVIPGPNIDLILLPHNTDNTLTYDSATGAFPGIPHSGVAHDPVTSKTYPIVNTSVSFRPGTVSGDATPGTTAEANNQALPTSDQATGYGYIPTTYMSTGQSWALPYHVSLYPGNYDGTQEYYDTQISSITDATNNPPLYTAGDLIESKHTDQNDATGTVVFNISKGYPLTNNGTKLGGTDFVPLTVNPDTGTLIFGTPSLPGGPTDRNDRNWNYGILDPANLNLGGVDTTGLIDLSKPARNPVTLMDSPLTNPLLAPADTNETGVKDAHIIPGGIRVTGPDTTPGPGNRISVPYTPVNSVADITGNQYYVDYSANTIKVSPEAVALVQLSLPPAPTDFVNKITVVYDYQSNMTLMNPAKPYSYGQTNANPPIADNTYLPMQVKVDYQTRDLIDVSIGVRIYDITNNRAQVIPSETKIKIGNSNRG